MNENINLCEILKGHEGEIFYSSAFGNVRLKAIDDDNFENFPIYIHDDFANYYFTNDGKCDEDGECVLFPSKDQRDWNKWAEEQKPKVPKTWNELINVGSAKTLGVSTTIVASNKRYETIEETPIEKAALALLKINQLIEVGYGGNPTAKEKFGCNNGLYYILLTEEEDKELRFITFPNPPVSSLFVFYNEKQAEEFLTYKENIQLLKDFYMI